MIRYIFFLLLVFCLISCAKNDTSPATQEKRTIIALGDSLTAGLGVSEEGSYPAQLETKLTKLGYNYALQNAGISGDTTAGLLSRIDAVLDGSTPSLIVLCIGANDAFQEKSTDDIEANIRAIIEKIQKKNIPLLLAGMKAPLIFSGTYRKRYEAIFPKLAKEYDLVYMDFFLEGVALKAHLNQDDRIHPTASGYTIVVENLFDILKDEKLIQK